MKQDNKSKILFFLLGVALTVIFVMASTAIKAEKQNNQNFDVNTPASGLQQTNENSRDKPSPMDYFTESQIKVYKDKVLLDAKDIQWASFEDTKSMLPVISNNSNALQIVPKCPDEIQLGDIISYKSNYADGIIIHRVVFIGSDDDGTYFVLKGDNNPSSDPGKIRCSQIQRKVVAILY
jgi:hypothetical protein